MLKNWKKNKKKEKKVMANTYTKRMPGKIANKKRRNTRRRKGEE